MKSYIIGLAGKKGCGKDTVASMINYIFAVGATKAKYSNWLVKRVSLDKTHKDRIIHFADSLKDCLSIIYNIPREYFDNRKYKDEMFYCLTTGKFISEKDIERFKHGFNIITINTLKNSSINYELETYDKLIPVIKIRTLMQYFGTNICRDNLGSDIWIKSTLGKVVDIAMARRLCIVPDVRFTNEAAALHKDDVSLYGRVIKINRNNCDKDYHDSEIISFTTDYTINNNGSMTELFYQTLDICQKIILK